MRLVMSSSWRMVMWRQAGYWGSHVPIGSLMETALGFQLQQDHRGEGLGVAADLPQRAGGDRWSAVVAGGPVGQADGRPAAGEGDPQRHRGDVLGRAPGRQVIAEVAAQCRPQRWPRRRTITHLR
jgi:hypothetical protein